VTLEPIVNRVPATRMLCCEPAASATIRFFIVLYV